MPLNPGSADIRLCYDSCVAGFALVGKSPSGLYRRATNRAFVRRPDSDVGFNNWLSSGIQADVIPRYAEEHAPVLAFSSTGGIAHSLSPGITPWQRENQRQFVLPKVSAESARLGYLELHYLLPPDRGDSVPGSFVPEADEPFDNSYELEIKFVSIENLEAITAYRTSGEIDALHFVDPDQVALSLDAQRMAIVRSEIEQADGDTDSTAENRFFIDVVDWSSTEAQPQQVRSIELSGNRRKLPKLYWSPDGKYLVAEDRHDLMQLDVIDWSSLPDGDEGSSDSIRIRQEPDEFGRVTMNSNHEFVFGGNGTLLWRNKTDAVAIFDLSTGDKIAEHRVRVVEDRSRGRGQGARVEGFAWDARRQKLAVVFSDGSSRRAIGASIVDLVEGEFIRTNEKDALYEVNGFIKRIHFVAFDAKNDAVAVGFDNQFYKSQFETAAMRSRVARISPGGMDVVDTLPESRVYLPGDDGQSVVGLQDGMLHIIEIDGGNRRTAFLGKDLDGNFDLTKIDDGWAVSSVSGLKFFDANFKLTSTVLRWPGRGETALSEIFESGRNRGSYSRLLSGGLIQDSKVRWGISAE